jgi:hypothetical protein
VYHLEHVELEGCVMMDPQHLVINDCGGDRDSDDNMTTISGAYKYLSLLPFIKTENIKISVENGIDRRKRFGDRGNSC